MCLARTLYNEVVGGARMKGLGVTVVYCLYRAGGNGPVRGGGGGSKERGPEVGVAQPL